jgi:hypothetical protein
MIVYDDDDERKLYKIENYQDSSFQNFSSRIVFFSQYFRFFKKYFSKYRQERGEGWGGVVQEHESRKKKL